jgi:hypothetical protein
MRRTLTTIGSDIVLILDSSLRDRLKLKPHAEVDIEVNDETLVVRPVARDDPNPLRDAFQRVIDNPGELSQFAPSFTPDCQWGEHP